MKPGDLCPHCKKGILELIDVEENEIYNIDYLMCDECDSTYTVDLNV